MMQTLSNNLMTTIQGLYVNNNYNPALASHRGVFLDKAHPNCSNKYVLIQTGLVLGALMNSGIDFEWEVLKQDKSRKGFAETKAMIVAVYFKMTDPDLSKVGKFALYIINSGNRSKRISFAYGWLNGACLNGCIWGEILSKFSQVHYGQDAIKNVEEELISVVANVKQIIAGKSLKEEFDVIKKLQSTPVTEEVSLKIAQEAFALRYSVNPAAKDVFGENASLKIADLDLKSLTKSHRTDFQEQTLWNLYQSIHENLGGNFDHSKRKDVKKVTFKLIKNDESEEQVGKGRSLRNSNGIDDKVKFNMDLMELVKKELPAQIAA
jgi:hypothetical protein